MRLKVLGRALATAREAPGLFQLPRLHAPEDFGRLTAEAKRSCRALRDEVRNRRRL